MDNTINTLLDPEKLKTLEAFVGTMAIACVSLETMLNFQKSAYRQGLLQKEEEEETSKTICMQVIQLAGLYKKLTDLITQRCDIDADSVNEGLASLARATRRKTTRKQEAPDEQH